ncbi:M15 family metallopeptidase [Spirochaeta africana]|nr:M15 family metallopeptidase [Spirochaeta africana]
MHTAPQAVLPAPHTVLPVLLLLITLAAPHLAAQPQMETPGDHTSRPENPTPDSPGASGSLNGSNRGSTAANRHAEAPTAGTLPDAESGISQPLSPEQIMQALQAAYPHRIAEVAWRDNDWALRIDDDWIYFSHGRFLPKHLRDSWESYDPITFYHYPAELPEFEPPDAEQQQRFARILERRRTSPPRRHAGLYNAIWQAHDEASAYAQVKSIYFLGLQTMVHRDLLTVLAAIEAEIRSAARSDRELAAFLDTIAGVEGYSYRRIADTSSLSFHSYGAAIDIIPRSYQGRAPYWLWASQWNPEWYMMSYDERFMPPIALVEIFERHGFIWGGKWLLFDTIHFEYRPEILIMNGYATDTPIIHQQRFRF